MKWCDFLKILRVRAVEETDADGRVLDAEARRAASRAAARQKDTAQFLLARANQLDGKTRGLVKAAMEIPGWIKWAGWGLALIAGCWLAALDQQREINLLALPLIAILLWNAVIIMVSLWHGVRPESGDAPSPLMEKLATRVMGKEDAKENQQVAVRFRELAWPVMRRRSGFRLRAWLHIGAALLALGSVTGMYARGWSREYRAVWESTLLDTHSAQIFFKALFAPASRITGLAIPLDQLPDMHRGAEVAAKNPGAALPWIHLYAATLGLWVILPRVLLAGLEQHRATRVMLLSLQSTEWRDYVEGLRASIEGNGTPVCVLAHGLLIDDAARDRWRRLACSRWRDVPPVECQSIPVGAETEFVAAWEPSGARLMVIFNLSVTPEAEVQRTLVEGLLGKIAGPLLLALDDTEMKKRSAGFSDAAQRLAARVELWKWMTEGLPVTWI